MRLDGYVQRSGYATRKVARELIMNGHVLVDGNIERNPIAEVTDSSLVFCHNQRIIARDFVYYMFHKPAGCITARRDDRHKTVMDYMNQTDCNGIFPIGRLDLNTEGLLLLTNDGTMEHNLMHPDHHMEKEYYFWALGELKREAIKKIEEGIAFVQGNEIAKPCKITVITSGSLNKELHKQSPLFQQKIRLPHNERNDVVTIGTITITEGKKHQVKRMLKAVGCYVIYLKRIRIGGLLLDESLKEGDYRALTEEEKLRFFE